MKLLQAKIIGSALHVSDAEIGEEMLADEGDILEEELVLKISGRRRDDHTLDAE